MEDGRIIIAKLNEMHEDIRSLGKRLDRVEARLDQVEARLDQVEASLDSVETRLDAVEDSVKDVRIYIEGPLWTAIDSVTNGHFDLYRKLDEAQKVDHEKEIMEMRIVHLENEMIKVQRTLAESA